MSEVPPAQLRLIGVGVGPGDAELVTLKAVRLLNQADVVLVPATEASGDGPGRAEKIVLEAAQPSGKIVRIPFSMSERRGVGPKREASWDASAAAAVEAFEAGASTVAFATVGDPSVYSTFSYLADKVLERFPEAAIEVVPGITAMQALAAAARTPLVEGQEVLCLFPNTADAERLDAVLQVADTVVVYKAGRKLPELVTQLQAQDREIVVGTDVSMESQRLDVVEPGAELAPAPYFSAVLSAPQRSHTGGRI